MSRDLLTDVGNADRYVREHRADLRYVAAWAKWLAWDGRRWVLDAVGEADERAKRTARGMYAEAQGAANAANAALARAKEAGDTELEQLQAERAKAERAGLAWALESHAAARVRAMPSLARSAPELAVRHDQLDADPWLLCVANGVIDLRIGELRAHDRGLLCTKLAPVTYASDATCPTWDKFLHEALGGDEDLLEWVRRWTGYALTGVVREHVLAFLFGQGGTGKSTYFRVLHDLLGDYAVRAPRKLLFAARGERHETELTTLHGARLVTCNEVEEGSTFDEALVKDLTGGEAITARRMREDHWTFAPTHKLAVSGNHKPRVRNFDEAIRRRLRLVPWVVRPAHPDPTLYDRLHAELPGILAWAVRGCIAWQRDGLGEPACVRAATDGYQEESDPLREFFDLHLAFEREARVPRVQIRTAYEDYTRENGAAPLGAQRFAAALRERGVEPVCVRHQGRPANGWRGVRLLTDAERERVGTRDAYAGIIEHRRARVINIRQPGVGTDGAYATDGRGAALATPPRAPEPEVPQ